MLNNPLKYTDPSGFFFKELQKFMHKHGRMVVGLVVGTIVGYQILHSFAASAAAAEGVAVATTYKGILAQAGLQGAAVSGAAAGAINSAMAPDATPGSILKGALSGGVRAGLAFHIGGLTDVSDMARHFLHGVTQGLISEVESGDFKSGFIGAFVGHAAGDLFKRIPALSEILGQPGDDGGMGKVIARTTVAAIIGGTASRAAGGKFANGAVSAAIAHLFNDERKLHPFGQRYGVYGVRVYDNKFASIRSKHDPTV